jgi:hypothetical protein
VGPQIFGVVHCASRCSVNNGRITGGGGLAIGLDSRGRLAATDLTIDNVVTGIEVAYGKVFLTNVSIQAGHFGIYPISRAVLDHVTVTLTDAQPSDCIGASQRSAGVSGNDVTVSGCGYGVLGDRKVAITRLTATGSTFGVAGKRVVLKDSTVTGNAIADIVSQKPPKLTNTACDHSAVYNGSGADDWNVCSAD